jgi:hypothetical protein
LFRSRDTNVRESELVVFITPEIISYADEPRIRQQMVDDTIRCRLDQIPEAEGCPPCCRSLPPGAMLDYPHYSQPAETGGYDSGDMFAPRGFDTAPTESLPPPQPVELPPLSAVQIPSAQLQLSAADKAQHGPTTNAVGRLRRLPVIDRRGPQAVVPASSIEPVVVAARPVAATWQTADRLPTAIAR